MAEVGLLPPFSLELFYVEESLKLRTPAWSAISQN